MSSPSLSNLSKEDVSLTESMGSDGLQGSLIAFLNAKFAALESKFENKFHDLEESIKSLNHKIDDTHKLVKKMHSSRKHSDSSPLLEHPKTSASAPSIARPNDSPTSHKRIKRGSSKLSSLEHLKISVPDRENHLGSDTSEPGTPTMLETPKAFSRYQIVPLPYSEEQLEGVKRGASIIQNYFRTCLEKKKYAHIKEQIETRTHIANELYDTEMNYVQTLLTIQTVFVEPLQIAADSPKPILTKAEIRELFNQIQVFYGINSEFLKLLTPLMKNFDPIHTQLGTVFIGAVAHFLKVYGASIENYSHQLNTIKTMLLKNTEFSKFVAAAELKPECKMQDLSLMMLTVIQRIPRYKMLLTALQKATWPEHIDYQNITVAIQKIHETTQLVNEKKREGENMKRLLAIQSRLHGTDEKLLVASHRKYITELESHEVNKKNKLVMFLFNDSLLIAKEKNDRQLTLKQFCGLEGCRITMDTEPRRLRVDAPLNTYLLETDDISKKTAFFDHFQLAKSEFSKKQVDSRTVNPRTMFNLSHGSASVSEGLSSSYRRRPPLSTDTFDALDPKSESESPPITRGSPPASKKMTRSASALPEVSGQIISPKSLKAEKRKSFRS